VDSVDRSDLEASGASPTTNSVDAEGWAVQTPTSEVSAAARIQIFNELILQ
jgi:hypothetical protein